MDLRRKILRERYFRKILANAIPYKPWRKAVLYATFEMGFIHFMNYLYYEFLSFDKFQKTLGNYNPDVKKDKQISFENELSVVSIIKNEARYIREWLEFHLLVGVEKFYIYDNESTDNVKEILSPYVKAGIVKLIDCPGKAQQCYAYMDAMCKYANKTKWLAIIDLDEFIVPLKDEKITDFLKDFNDYCQILIGWNLYGSSGHKTRREGLLIENYKYHAADDYITNSKVIVNPRAIRGMLNPHWCFPYGLSVDENKKIFDFYPYTNKYFSPISKKKICINHYYCKSWQEYDEKIKKGCADGNVLERNRSLFNYYDKNDVFDPIMDKYIEPVKKAIEERNRK
ncbi:MAG: glycosyltransferase family 92 protein [Elusimicrobiota bacterium]|jgi:hypothetical protein|nr:glycosyltransferase family 92 protein [Elusimicrobiota bacterium]